MKYKLNTNKGMTLIELTVVILVLLSLIAVLFIGATAWKEGSDRAQCIVNISNIQKAGRSLQNMYEFAPGDAFDATRVPGDPAPANLKAAITGNASAFLETEPLCPSASNATKEYTYTAGFPVVGSLFATCNLAATKGHTPRTTLGW